MRKQKQYYINGLILLIIAMISITMLPHLADKLKLTVEKSSFSEFEFFALCASALFYLFSPRYYKNQVLSIIFAFLYYFLFLKMYPIF